MVEAINEFRIEAGAVPRTETPLSVMEILHSGSFRSRMANFLLGVVAGTGLDIVEGLATGMENVYGLIDGWMGGDYERHMAALRRDGKSLSQQQYTSLEVIGKRNRFIEDLKISGQLYRKRRLPQTAVVKGLERVLIAQTKLTGQENLDLVTEKIGQERVTVAANHTSDTDHASLERVFIKNGYGAIADHLVFPAGLKMWDRSQTEWAMWGMNTVPIAAPAYFEEATRIAQWPLSEEERELVVQYQANIRWLTIASLKALLPKWKRGEVVPVIYPETTRSRSGLIERGREETDGYFKHGLILPLMIQGPGEVFPPEHHPRWDKIIMRGFQVSVAVGELISGEVLHASATRNWLGDRNANPVDFVMSRIVSLDPKRANPTLKPLYDSLAQGIPSGLILNSA